jgi:hypothetical protein
MRKGTKRYITLLAAVAFSALTLAQDAGNQLLLKYFHSISSEEIADWMTEMCDRNTTAGWPAPPNTLKPPDGWRATLSSGA